jgi:pimeloyl-ACP methyl ester carboxylesterase
MNLPALVLLPGLDGTGKLHTAFRSALPPELSVSCIPYPGDLPLDYAALTDYVFARLPSEADFVLLAESYAGPLAVRLAARAPRGLKGVIFSTSFAKNPWPALSFAKPIAARLSIRSLPRWFRALFMWGSARRGAAPAQAERASAGVDDAVLRQRMLSVLTVDDSALLRRVALPSLVMRATRDLIVPRAAARLLMRQLPQARLVTIEGPHLLLQSRPQECAAAVLDYLRRLPT